MKIKYSASILFIPLCAFFAFGNSQMKHRKTSSEKTLSVAEAVEQVKPSIIQISVVVKDMNLNPMRQDMVLGTGFLVSREGYVITANHVVSVSAIPVKNRDRNGTVAQILYPVNPSMMRIGVPMPEINTAQVKVQGAFNVFEFDIVEQDNRHDLALLKFRKNPFDIKFTGGIKAGDNVINTASRVISAKIAKSKPKDGEQIIISGYPGVATTLVTTVGHVATTGETDFGEIEVPSPFPQIPGLIKQFDVMDLYLGDITANPGNSGGPVYLSKTGEVIGVCTAIKLVRNYYAGLAILVPIRYAVELLQKHKIA
jgi:S1-C subfamily serine protease